MTIVLLVCLYVQEPEPDESRLNHYCAIEARSLPCDIKVKVLPDGSYSFASIQIKVKSVYDKENLRLDDPNPKVRNNL